MNGSPSVKVALFIRNGGSESPCRWFYITGIYSRLVHRFRNNYTTHLSANSIAQMKKPQRSPLRLRFFICTLESISCAIGIVIYETMY